MATKSEDRKPNTPVEVADPAAIPAAPEGKGEKRLFQDGPGEKKWLTKAEAVKAGKFWAD